MKQGQNESDDSFFERFKDMVNTVEMVHGENVFFSPDIVGKSFRDATGEERFAVKEANQAVLMLINNDPIRYSELSSSLRNSSNLGVDEYPKSLPKFTS